MEDILEHAIASRVKQLRARRGMTLKQLSEATGLSKGLLSKIENCNVSPPVATLSKLAKAFNVPIGEFFETEDLDPGTVYFPKSKRQTVHGRRSSYNYDYTLLVSGRKRRDMQPMMIAIDGKTYKFGLVEHEGEEFVLMMEGVMNYVIGDQTHTVYPGDCLYFDARLPHGPKLTKDQSVQYLAVHTSV